MLSIPQSFNPYGLALFRAFAIIFNISRLSVQSSLDKTESFTFHAITKSSHISVSSASSTTILNLLKNSAFDLALHEAL